MDMCIKSKEDLELPFRSTNEIPRMLTHPASRAAYEAHLLAASERWELEDFIHDPHDLERVKKKIFEDLIFLGLMEVCFPRAVRH